MYLNRNEYIPCMSIYSSNGPCFDWRSLSFRRFKPKIKDTCFQVYILVGETTENIFWASWETITWRSWHQSYDVLMESSFKQIPNTFRIGIRSPGRASSVWHFFH